MTKHVSPIKNEVSPVTKKCRQNFDCRNERGRGGLDPFLISQRLNKNAVTKNTKKYSHLRFELFAGDRNTPRTCAAEGCAGACDDKGIFEYAGASSEARILFSRLGVGSPGLDFALQFWILRSRLGFSAQAWIFRSRLGFCASGLDFALQAWILRSRLGFCAPGLDLALQGWILRSRLGFCAPGLDLALQACIWLQLQAWI